MKNFKKTLSFVLALTLVCAAALIPASAVTASDSFAVRDKGYICNGTLDMDDHSVTATFDAFETGGELKPDPYCYITGTVFYTDSTGRNSSAPIEAPRGELSCSDFVSVDGVTVRANATYHFNGASIDTLRV